MKFTFDVQLTKLKLNCNLYYIRLSVLDDTIIHGQIHSVECNDDNDISYYLGLTLQEYQDIITSQFNHIWHHKQIYFESASDCKKVIDWFNKNLDSFITMKALE